MTRSNTSIVVAYIGSFLFAILLLYSDEGFNGFKSWDDVFSWVTFLFGTVFAIPIFLIISLLSLLKLNENIGCLILLALSFLLTICITNQGDNYWLGVALFTIYLFFPLGIIYVVSERVGKSKQLKQLNK